MTVARDVDAVLCDLQRREPERGRVVFVSGNFNILHVGHLRLLQFAAECGDVLVVGVLDNGGPGVHMPASMRIEGVSAIRVVNYSFLIREPLEDVIRKLRPDVIVKGKEHEGHHNIEKDLLDSHGGTLLFSSGEVRFSSHELIERAYSEMDFSSIRKPPGYPRRHDITVDAIKAGMRRFGDLRITVVGDLIVDEYVDCDPLGMSQEDPAIVVTPIDRKQFVGGAGIAAAHARGLGAEVNYFTVLGNDPAAGFAMSTLRDYGVDVTAITDVSRPTTVKRRYRAAGKTLLRVSELRQHAVSPDIAGRMLELFTAAVAGSDMVIFSDFNYGCLPQPLVDSMIATASAAGVPMVADSQASSQLSDISRFRGMRLITPTEREARLALRDNDSGLVVLAEQLRKRANAENVVITLGAEGLLVFARKDGDWMTDRLPAMNTAPKDTAGAGDSFLTCASMALCAGMDIWSAAYLGAIAAACQVSRVGNTPLSPQDLLHELDRP